MEIVEFLKKLTTDILKKLDINTEVEVVENNEQYRVSVKGEDLGILIGYHGDTLYAFQTIIGLSTFKKFGEWKYILFDVNEYRVEREEKLRKQFDDISSRSRFLQKEIELSPMNATDRRFIHLLAQEMGGVVSESTGEGFNRRVVIKPDIGERISEKK